MKTRRISMVVVAAFAVLGVVIGFTSATSAKTPTAFIYKDCSSKTVCKATAATIGNKFVSLQVMPKCSDPKVSIPGYNEGNVRINKKSGKYKMTVNVTTYSYATEQTVRGTMEVSGTVRKRKKVTGKWSVDKVVSECEGVKTGTFSAKFKGTQKGG